MIRKEGQNLWSLWVKATAVEEGTCPAPGSPCRVLGTGSYMGLKLTAMLTIGDEVPVGPKAVLQTVCLFASRGFFLLLFLLFLIFFLFTVTLTVTPHIPDALDKENNGL